MHMVGAGGQGMKAGRNPTPAGDTGRRPEDRESTVASTGWGRAVPATELPGHGALGPRIAMQAGQPATLVARHAQAVGAGSDRHGTGPILIGGGRREHAQSGRQGYATGETVRGRYPRQRVASPSEIRSNDRSHYRTKRTSCRPGD